MKKTFVLLFFIIAFYGISAKGQQGNDINNDINRIIVHENRFDKLIDLAKLYMETNGKKSLSFEGLLASLKPSYVRTMFDSKLLKEKDIDTYNKYTYEQSMSSSLSIKLDM